MKTSSQDVLITKNGLYTNDNQQENDINSVMAGTADNNIKNINDPNYLSPFEKPQLQVQMDNFATIYAADKDIATSEGIDFTAYEAAYQAYVAYMTPLVADISAYSPINRDTYNSMVTAVQDQQKALDSATKAQYDTAINQAKTDIANGQAQYQTMQIDAANMKSDAANVATTASQAIASAGFANDTANAAQSSAMAAVNQAGFASDASVQASQAASSAVASAMSAESNASSAVSIANSTASAFGPVKQSADSALSAASSAVAIASSTASGFGKVSQKTDSALTSAVNAQSAASDAVKQASSAAADSKDAKQIAGAVSQSYKTLTDGSTMTIAELENGLAAKLTKTDLDGYATQVWTQNKIKVTADDISGNLSSVKKTVDGQTTSINDLKADSSSFKSQFTTVNNTLGKQSTDIGTLKATSKELTSGFNTLTTDNNTNKNDISQLKQTSKEVNSTLETVQTQVNNSAVGTNLITNSNFSSGLDHWAINLGTNSDCKATVTTDSDGDTCAHITGTGTACGLYRRPVSFDQNQVTTGSVLVKGTGTVSLVGLEDRPASTFGTISIESYSKVGSTAQAASTTNTFCVYFNPVDGVLDVYIKFVKLELGSHATDWCPNPADNATVTALTQVKQTADGAQVLAANNQGDITSIQETAKGLQSSVNSKASSDQLTQLSDQLTNEIKKLSSSTSSKFTQTSNDINGLVKKGDVVNQLNIDAGGILLDTSGSTAKIILSSNNIELDSANPVVMGSANITNLLTSKTIEASSITSTTKIIGSDIEAPIIHSPSGLFKLDGNTGDIIGASIHSADNSWGIDKNGNINGATINAPTLNLGNGGQLTGSYSVNDSTNYFQPINGTGSLKIANGYIQSTANVSYYNKILNGISGDKWGHWASSTQFIPATDQANPGTGNVAESTLTPAFLKLDIFNADKSLVKSRAYIDGTGLYINDGQTQSIVSMLSDYELISNGMAYLNSGIQMNKRASFTFGNLVLNGYHTIAMLDGKAINFTSATSHGRPIEVKAKTFTKLSQLSIKHDITPLSTAESSRLLNAIDVEKFRYTHDGATFKYQYGGVIDDVNSLGSKKYSMPPELLNEDGTGINLDSLTGILIKTVQEQERKIGKLSMRLTKLEMKK